MYAHRMKDIYKLLYWMFVDRIPMQKEQEIYITLLM